MEDSSDCGSLRASEHYLETAFKVIIKIASPASVTQENLQDLVTEYSTGKECRYAAYSR